MRAVRHPLAGHTADQQIAAPERRSKVSGTAHRTRMRRIATRAGRRGRSPCVPSMTAPLGWPGIAEELNSSLRRLRPMPPTMFGSFTDSEGAGMCWRSEAGRVARGIRRRSQPGDFLGHPRARIAPRNSHLQGLSPGCESRHVPRCDVTPAS